MLRIEIFRCAALLVIQKHAFSEKKQKNILHSFRLLEF